MTGIDGDEPWVLVVGVWAEGGSIRARLTFTDPQARAQRRTVVVAAAAPVAQLVETWVEQAERQLMRR
jgi:hypothetical protein